MDKKSKRKIRIIASKILKEIGYVNHQVDLNKVLDYLGLSIYSLSDSEKMDSTLYYDEGDNEWKICIASKYINNESSKLKLRMLVAKEIGSYKFGNLFIAGTYDLKVDYANTKISRRVIAENKFAAELLMPYDSLMYLIATSKEVNDDLIIQWAKTYKVSPIVMAYRVNSVLGEIKGMEVMFDLRFQ